MRTLTIALAAALLSTSALAAGAAAIDAVEKMADGNSVKVSGTITNIHMTENEFTVSDSTGRIDVESKDKVTLKKGDTVTVEGTLQTDVMQKEIAANSITKTGHDATWTEKAKAEAQELKQDTKEKYNEVKSDVKDTKSNY